ncbi:ATP-binding protein [Kitasatospora sp. NPDC088548]|uniref:ATP-binding protein n=1 Tax=Kitasatospora sp. NPDC088548 TaxID=3364075 RepID=UPI003827551E
MSALNAPEQPPADGDYRLTPVPLATWEVKLGDQAVPATRRQLTELIANRALPLDRTACYDAKVCLSELLTNANRHAGGALEVRVHWTGTGGLLVEVVDGSLVLPEVSKASQTSTTGRGLFLVEELATAWGWEPTGAGKKVWFEIGSKPTISEDRRFGVLVARNRQLVHAAPATAPSSGGSAEAPIHAPVRALPRRVPGQSLNSWPELASA